MELALGLIGSLAAVVVIVTLIVRSAARGLAAGMAPIAGINEVMRRAGQPLGLTFEASGPGYGRLVGQVGGVPVEVRVTCAYYDYLMQLFAPASKPLVTSAKKHFSSCGVHYRMGSLVLDPPVQRIKAGRYVHWVVSDASELRGWIEQLARFVANASSITG
jgi:hypothetical protein